MATRARVGMALGAVIAGCGIGISAAYLFGFVPGGPEPTAVDDRTGGPGGPFTLTDDSGATVTDQDYRGRYLLVFFGYTFCPDVCPTTLADIAAAMDALGDDAAAVQPLFVSVDPARDTPEKLAAFVDSFDPRIVGLTGTEEQLAAIKDGYGVLSEIVPNENDPAYYLVNHTAGIFLMDREGRFVRVFGYPTTTDQIVGAIRETMRADAAAS
ncbi:MAG: SCO family protein [Alphaproteobacteria bacterium]